MHAWTKHFAVLGAGRDWIPTYVWYGWYVSKSAIVKGLNAIAASISVVAARNRRHPSGRVSPMWTAINSTNVAKRFVDILGHLSESSVRVHRCELMSSYSEDTGLTNLVS